MTSKPSATDVNKNGTNKRLDDVLIKYQKMQSAALQNLKDECQAIINASSPVDLNNPAPSFSENYLEPFSGGADYDGDFVNNFVNK